MEIGKIEFKKADLVYQNGKVYYRAAAGLQERGYKCIRNICQYKLYAFHQDCTLSYTRYCLVDTKTNNVYESGEYHPDFCILQNIRADIISALKSKIEKGESL